MIEFPLPERAAKGLPTFANPPIEASLSGKGALRLSVRTTAFHVVKTGSTPVGRATFRLVHKIKRLVVDICRFLLHFNTSGIVGKGRHFSKACGEIDDLVATQC
jgi:hypothetical protein